MAERRLDGVPVSHRGSGRGPHTVDDASRMDASEWAAAVAIRRDRLVALQRVPYRWDAKRQAEIDALGAVHRLFVAFDTGRHAGGFSLLCRIVGAVEESARASKSLTARSKDEANS